MLSRDEQIQRLQEVISHHPGLTARELFAICPELESEQALRTALHAAQQGGFEARYYAPGQVSGEAAVRRAMREVMSELRGYLADIETAL